jgi:hypothetical protein
METNGVCGVNEQNTPTLSGVIEAQQNEIDNLQELASNIEGRLFPIQIEPQGEGKTPEPQGIFETAKDNLYRLESISMRLNKVLNRL